MGFKRDKFVVRIRPEFEETALPEILKAVPEKFHRITSKLWNHFQNLPDMINTENYNSIFKILEESGRNWGIDDLSKYFGIYRSKDCLQQVLRENFFDTLLIIQNVYSQYAINLFQVVNKDQIINVVLEDPSEDDHLGTPPSIEEEVFNRTIAKTYAEDLISEYNWEKEDPTELKYLRSKIVNMRDDSIESIQHPL